MPVYLEDAGCIECFVVDEAALHSALLKFLSGQHRVQIGFGEADVDTKHYLRNMREYKISSGVNYGLCGAGKGAAA